MNPLTKLQRFYDKIERLRRRFQLEQMTNYKRSHTERIEQLERLLEAIQEQIDTARLKNEGGQEWYA